MCDPDPEEPGDLLLEFVSFAEPDALTRWVASDGYWLTDEADVLGYASPAFATYGVRKDTRGNLPQPFTALVQVRIDAWPEAKVQVGLIATTQGLNTGIACSVIRPTPGMGGDFAQVYQSTTLVNNVPIGHLANGDVLEFRYAYDPGKKRAACAVGDVKPALTIGAGAVDGPFGFEANGGSVSFLNATFYTR